MYSNVIGKCFMLFVSAIIIQSVFQASICFPGGEIQARVSEKAMKEKWARGGIESHRKITQNDTKANEGPWSRGGIRNRNTRHIKSDTNFTAENGAWSRGGHHQDFKMRKKMFPDNNQQRRDTMAILKAFIR